MKYHQSGQSDQGNKQPLTLNILGWGAGGWGGDLYYGGKSGETTFKVILYSKRKEGKSLKKKIIIIIVKFFLAVIWASSSFINRGVIYFSRFHFDPF